MQALRTSDDLAYARTLDYVASSSSSVLPTPPSLTDTITISTSTADISTDETDDVARLKAELEAAKGKIARMDQELAQTRITKHTIDQVIGNNSEADSQAPMSSNPSVRPPFLRDGSWATQDDAQSDTSDALSASGFNRARAIWNNSGYVKKPLGISKLSNRTLTLKSGGNKATFSGYPGPTPAFQPSEALSSSQWMSRSYGQPFVEAPVQLSAPPAMGGAFRGSPIHDEMMNGPPTRRPHVGRFNNRTQPPFSYTGSNGSYDSFNASMAASFGSISAMSGQMGGSMGAQFGGYQPQPIGTPLSPHAPEFTSSGWKAEVSSTRPPTI